MRISRPEQRNRIQGRRVTLTSIGSPGPSGVPSVRRRAEKLEGMPRVGEVYPPHREQSHGLQSSVWPQTWRLLSTLLACVGLMALVGGGLVGCNANPLSSSVIDVQPRQLSAQKTETITLTGHFYPLITLSASTGVEQENRNFYAALHKSSSDNTSEDVVYPLQNLRFQTAETLLGETPVGLSGGSYRLEVRDPSGVAISVPSDLLIEVPDVQADHASLSATSRYLPVGGSITLTAGLVNTDGSVAQNSAERIELFIYSVAAEITAWEGPGLTYSEILDDQNTRIGLHVQALTNDQGIISVTLTNSQVESFLVKSYTPELPHYEPDQSFNVIGLSSNYEQMLVLLPGQTVADVSESCIGTEESGSEGEVAPTEDALEFRAGSPFDVRVQAVDTNCQPVEALSASFELLDAMTGEPAPLFIPGATSMELKDGAWLGYLQYDDLTETRLVAIGPDQKYAFSSPFSIVPGEARGLVVTLLEVPEGGALQAGSPFIIQAVQLDAYDNPVPFDQNATFTLDDDTGTLHYGHWLLDGATVTFAGSYITKATTGTRIRVNQVGGKQGVSVAYPVLAGPAAGLLVTPPSAPVIAGETFDLGVAVVDIWKNPVPGTIADQVGLQAQLFVEGQAIESPQSLLLSDGQGVYTNVLNTVTGAAWLGVSSDDLQLEAQGEPFEVTNNEAVTFKVDVCPDQGAGCQWTAGLESPLALTAYDAFGNLAIDFSGSVVLTSNQETLDPADYTITGFENGTVLTTRFLTRAGDTELTATSGPAVGRSPTFTVLPGAARGYAFRDTQRLYWRNEPFILQVAAVDAYDNQVTTANERIYLQDKAGGLAFAGSDPPRFGIVVTLEAGLATAEVVLTKGGHEDEFSTTVNNVAYTSSSFEVYDRSCSPTLAPALSANGRTDQATVCLVNHVGSGVSGRVEFAVSSTPALKSFLLLYGDDTGVSGNKNVSLTHDYGAAGRFEAELYVADENFCASDVGIPIYVGPDDGSALGPMQLIASNTTLLASSDLETGQSAVTLQALDCQGDAAASQEFITLISDLGGLLNGDDSDALLGNQLKLDRRGMLQFDYSVADEPYGGAATLVAVSETGLAEGTQQFTITNDLVPPFVLTFSPLGRVVEAVSELRVRFSEPLRGGDALQFPAITVVSMLQGSLPIASRTLEEGGRELILTLAEPVRLDTQSDIVTVTLPSARNVASLTDLDGNRLDGNWSGLAEDSGDPFIYRFGSAPVTPFSATLNRCEITPTVFSPDGRDGTQAEAATVRLEADISSSRPLKAVAFKVADTKTNQEVDWNFLGLKQSSTSVQASFQWDGTGLDGRVLPNGNYSILFMVLDEQDLLYWLPCPTLDGLALLNPVDLGGYP